MTDNEIGKNRKKLREQFRALYDEADYGFVRAGDFMGEAGSLQFFRAEEELPKVIKRIRYRLKRITEIWKEC